ncbi:MAG: methylated-DNA--[protein]-cysteine S-methyltransferase [Thermoleophilia bacterium]
MSTKLVDSLKEGPAPAGEARRVLSYDTRYGRGLLVWRGSLLVAHHLPRPDSSGPGTASGHPSAGLESDLADALKAYFAGRRIEFDAMALPLDLGGCSRFELDVVRALAAVPYGETRSYAQVADAAGHPRAQRAVGSFMSRNSFPLILPCHRVIKSSGALGDFSSGRHWKKRMLALEGASLVAPPDPGNGRPEAID